MDGKEYPVSEAVRLIGVESHVLRYWEDELQMEIRRNGQGHRVYSMEDIDAFRRVKELKEKGLQLKAIRLLMDERGRFCPGSDAEGDSFARQVRELAGGNVSGARSAEQGEDSSEEQDTVQDGDPEEVCCEIVPAQEVSGDMYQFRQILRRLIEEVVSEQNEKLEEALAGRMREELEDFYLQCCQAMQEAAASLGPESRKRGRMKRALRRLLGLER